MNVIILYSPGREGEVLSLAALLRLKEIPFLAEKAEPPGIQNWKEWIERMRFATYSVFLPGKESWESPFWLWAGGYAMGAHERSYLHSLEGSKGPFDDFHFIVCETFDEIVSGLWEDHSHWLTRQAQRRAQAELTLRGREVSVTGLITAIKDNDLEDLTLYLEAGFSPASVDRRGVSLLHHAIRSGRLEAARILIDKGAPLNLISGDRGNTPLMDAAAEGEVEILKILLERGVDLEVRSKSGQTALILATGRRCVDCVRLLVQNGADPHQRDHLGLNSVDYARALGFSEILSILEGRSEASHDPDCPDPQDPSRAADPHWLHDR